MAPWLVGTSSGATETHSNRCASAKVGGDGTKGHRSVMGGEGEEEVGFIESHKFWCQEK
jgi:hypothetical protein